MDFTIEKYKELLTALKKHKNFSIKHDVDLKPHHSLRIAQEEASVGITSTYYFRTTAKSYDEQIIQQIVSLGHSIGYHYENLAICHGDMAAAYDDFCCNLEKLRKIAPVTTACAHGSPLSKWDNQKLWNQYDIRSLGIVFEPMLDTDFSHTLYLTDTGRRWDGQAVSIRDKVNQSLPFSFHSTDDIIKALNDINHPIHHYSLLINTHPQRWMPFGSSWLKEVLLQNTKNIVKRLINSHHSHD